jgi:hypothetical protein
MLCRASLSRTRRCRCTQIPPAFPSMGIPWLQQKTGQSGMANPGMFRIISSLLHRDRSDKPTLTTARCQANRHRSSPKAHQPNPGGPHASRGVWGSEHGSQHKSQTADSRRGPDRNRHARRETRPRREAPHPPAAQEPHPRYTRPRTPRQPPALHAQAVQRRPGGRGWARAKPPGESCAGDTPRPAPGTRAAAQRASGSRSGVGVATSPGPGRRLRAGSDIVRNSGRSA